MAFNAGAIEATLTLNRNPFTAGLAAARSQARSFANEKYEATVGIKVNQRELLNAKAALKNFADNVTATATINVQRTAFDRMVRDLRSFDRSRYTARLDLDTARANSGLSAFEARLLGLRDRTINLNTDVDNFGRTAGNAFNGAAGHASHFEKILLAIAYALPLIASAIVATGGALGVLLAQMVTLGLGLGAFAAVAVPVFKDMKKAVDEGAGAIAKLPPGVREAANAFVVLKGAYDQLIKDNQTLVGIALAAWFDAGTAALRTLNPLVQATANAMAIVGARFEAFFNSPWWSNFIKYLSAAIGPALVGFGDALIAIIQIIGNFTQAIMMAGGQEIWGMIVGGLQQFAQWTEKIGQNKTFIAFMEAAQRSLPIVGNLLASLLEFVLKLSIGLAPLGDMIAQVLTAIFNAINQLSPAWIGTITTALLAFWAALAFGLGPAAGLIIAAIIGVVTGLKELYVNSEQVRNAVDGFAKAFMNILRPAIEWIGTFIKSTVLPALEEFAAWFVGASTGALNSFATFMTSTLFPVFSNLANFMTTSVIPAIRDFVALVESKLGPVWTTIVDIWDTRLFPALQSLWNVIQTQLWPALQSLWQSLVDVAIAIGEKVSPKIEPLIDTFLEKFVPAIVRAVEVIILLGEEVAIWLGIFIKALAWFIEVWAPGIGEVFGFIVQAIDGAFSMISGALDVFTGIFTGNWQLFFDGLNTIAEGFWTIIAGLFGLSFEELKAKFQQWDTDMNGIWTGFETWFVEGWNRLETKTVEDWTTWSTTVKDSFQNDLVTPLQDAFTAFETWWTEGWVRLFEASGQEVQTGSERIKTSFQEDLIAPVQEAIETFITWFTEGWARLFEQANQEVQSGLQTIEQFINDTLQAIEDFFSQWGDRISTNWTNLWDDMGRIVDDAARIIGQAIDGIANAWNTVMGWLGGGSISSPGGARGGMADSNQGAGGGFRRFDRGGPVHGPGTGTSDSIIARIANGEYIIPARVTRQILPFLNEIRGGSGMAMSMARMFSDGRKIAGFANGGLAGLPRFASGGSTASVQNADGSVTTTTTSWMDMWTKFGAAATSLFNSIIGSLPAFPAGEIGQSASSAPPSMVSWALGAVQRYLSSIIETITSTVTQFFSANGGLITADAGGAIGPGRTIVQNNTGGNEYILTPRQWSALERNANKFGKDGDIDKLVRSIVAEVQPMYGALHVTTTPRATAQDIIGEATFQARAARKRGPHI